MSRRGQGTCQQCDRELTTTVGGRMLRHNADDGFRCPGSGRYSKENLAEEFGNADPDW